MNVPQLVSTVSDIVMLGMHVVATVIMITVVAFVTRKARSHITPAKKAKRTDRQDKFLMLVGVMVIIVSSWANLTLSVIVGLVVGGPLAYAVPQWAGAAGVCFGLVFIAAGRLVGATMHKPTVIEFKEAAKDAEAQSTQSSGRRAAQRSKVPAPMQRTDFVPIEAILDSQ